MTEIQNTNKYAPKHTSYFGFAAIGIIVPTAMYLYDNFGYLIGQGTNFKSDSKMSIWLPIIAVPLVISGTYYTYMKRKKIASRGQIIQARITSISKFATKNMKDITFDYKFNDKTFENSKSINTEIAQQLSPGQEIEIMIDPINPKIF